MSLTIYWAGPLFTQAERVWNRRCAAGLERHGYTVILPQVEANQFISGKVIDYMGIAKHCAMQAVQCDVLVAVLDGADSDSGTSIEAGIKIGYRTAKGGKGKIIGVRTDFRASSDDGDLNAMFRLFDDVVRFPSFNEDPDALCDEIDAAICKLDARADPLSDRARPPVPSAMLTP
jgi:nucleoside 2-deoxyribosyltransferase